MHRFALALGLMLALAAGASAQNAPSASHLQAAETVVDLMNMEDTMRETQELMLSQMMGQNPMMEQFGDIIADITQQASNPEALRPEMVQMYADLYTEAELHELAAFYRTPIGQKTLEVTPQISLRSMEMVQRRMEPLVPEMMRRIQERMAASERP